uniref:Pectinesterase/pectinesterase inhibitor 12 n=1 Tax=Striga hermonthica TaxID=68872 RepID=A0AA49K3R9_STRHE|nr:pectinesterase/pectinesterase inhibitor 12 [Striga hermonthica]
MASSILKALLILSSLYLISTPTNAHNPSSSSSSYSRTQLSSLKSLCKTTPNPDHCLDAAKLSVSVNLPTNLISFVIHTLRTALSQGLKLSTLLSAAAGGRGLVEKQRGAVQDCTQLHQITRSALQKSISHITSGGNKIDDARTFLSAALTNRATCLEGLDSAAGPMKLPLLAALDATYAHVGNSLSILSRRGQLAPPGRRRLLGYPRWLSGEARRALQISVGSMTRARW